MVQGGSWAAGPGPLSGASPEAPAGSFHFNSGRVVVDLNKAVALRRTGAALAVVDTERGLNLIVIHAGRGLFVALDRSRAHADVRAYETRREGDRLLVEVGGGG